MEKHQQIINLLESIENWENEEQFLIDALMLSNTKLFLKCYKDLEENSIVTIAPLLRNIQENMIVILGLTGNVFTLKEFIEKEVNPKKIMNSLIDSNLELDINKFELINKYFHEIKNALNKFSHSNFISAMTLFTDRFQVHESIFFNKIMITFYISLLEAPFIAMTNILYKTDIKMPENVNLNKELKEINSFKYVTRKFPESIKEFINKSEILQGYYSNIFSQLRKEYKEIKDYSLVNQKI